MKILLDTDIGSDVDDALALALALNSSEIELCGITTVYGPVELRAKIALTILKKCNIDTPVGIGQSQPLSTFPEIWTTGFEKKNLEPVKEDIFDDYKFYDGIELLKNKILENPGEITIVCIAPMTNIATLITKYPQVVPEIKRIVFMGGGIEKESFNDDIKDAGVSHIENQYNISAQKGYRSFYEHNLGADPQAAMTVLQSPIPKVMVGKNITHAAKIAKPELWKILNKNNQIHFYLKYLCQIWLKFWQKDYFLLHDPLTMQIAFDKLLKLEYTPVNIYVDQTGYKDYTGDIISFGFCLAFPSSNNYNQAILKVDFEKFFDTFSKRLSCF